MKVFWFGVFSVVIALCVLFGLMNGNYAQSCIEKGGKIVNGIPIIIKGVPYPTKKCVME